MPLRSSEPSTQAYLEAKLRSYEVCVENECYEDAYVNAHLLFVYWLYCKLWTVVQAEPKLVDRIFALHSFDSKFNREKFLKSESALTLHQLKLEERKYAEVFGAICLDREDVKQLKGLVDARNAILHPSGVTVVGDMETLDDKLQVQSRLASKIAAHMAPKYIKLVEPTYKRISYSKLLRWENDYDLEQRLVTKFQLADIDLKSVKKFLRTRR
jgi:hypothetical protein